MESSNNDLIMASPISNVSSAALHEEILDFPPSPSLQKLTQLSASEMIKIARNAFVSGKTKSIKFRKQQLKNFLSLLEDNEQLIVQALQRDLFRHEVETQLFELLYCKNDVYNALTNLDNWAKAEKPEKPILNVLDGVSIVNDPYGVVLVISAWNFPFNLLFSPFVGALAAGNCVILKPSEISSESASLIAQLIPKYLDSECYQVYLGGVEEMSMLLNERFDYIFFTGSTTVGKIIHAAANKFLTPVTLELGGKCPVYIDETVNIEYATRRIMWGKLSNAGQCCISPDYILCTKEIQKQFLTVASKTIQEWYGNNVRLSPNFARIINSNHFKRLEKLIKDTNKISLGGTTVENELYIEPTILTQVSPNDLVMQEEIFGPILPIISVQDTEEAINFINSKEKPLALYVFTNNSETRKAFLENTSSGGLTFNDIIVAFNVESLPFGGVGYSGMGAYHGKFTFDTFTHKKSVLECGCTKINDLIFKFFYPPFTKQTLTMAKILFAPRRSIVPWNTVKMLMIFLSGIIFTIILRRIF